jgi:hypothetical protein
MKKIKKKAKVKTQPFDYLDYNLGKKVVAGKVIRYLRLGKGNVLAKAIITGNGTHSLLLSSVKKPIKTGVKATQKSIASAEPFFVIDFESVAALQTFAQWVVHFYIDVAKLAIEVKK